MNVHVLQHAPFEGLAGIAPLLTAHNAHVTTTRFFENATLPPLQGLDLIIAMGGPMSVNDEAEFPWLIEEKRFIREAVKRGIAVLGVCLGAQLIASASGARVYRNQQKEIGWFPIEATPGSVGGEQFMFPRKLQVFHWHGETFDLPAGSLPLAQSPACKNQAFQIGRRVIALQFHLEVTVEAVQAFVDHCGAELRPAPYIQTKAQLLSAPHSTYAEAHEWMRRVIEYLIK